jgi:signal transduction histidine kinase
MTADVWELFPFPTLSGEEFTPGSLIGVHPDCATCPTRLCVKDDRASPGEVKICRYGISYARIDESRILTGVLATDGVDLNSKAKRRLRIEPDRRFAAARIRQSVKQAREMGAGVVNDRELLRDEVLQRLEKDPEMHSALANRVRRDFEKNVQQSHDFLQLAKLVQGHAEALLAEKHPGIPPYEAAEHSQIEGAIYFSTQLMVLKLDALVFLQDPQRATENRYTFGIHQMVLKYARIYQWQAAQKDLTIRIDGACHSTALYNRAAIGAVLQGILDNLVKYAPAGSSATVTLDERADKVEISFNSLGPRITAADRSNIFIAGFRAEAARVYEHTGQGIGLATAHQVSEVLNLGLRVEQSTEEIHRFPGRYSTTFCVTLLRNDA